MKKASKQSDTEKTENRPRATRKRALLPPSPNPATNLLIADIVVRGASTLFRRNVEKRVAKSTSQSDEEADRMIDGRGIIRTLGLYGASRLATRSPLGLGVVAGGLVIKTLYDRGKARQQKRRARKPGK